MSVILLYKILLLNLKLMWPVTELGVHAGVKRGRRLMRSPSGWAA